MDGYTLKGLAAELSVHRYTLRRWLRILGYTPSEGIKRWFERLGLTRYAEYAHSLPKAFVALRRKEIKFYTIPPLFKGIVVPWPWIIVNVFNIGILENCVDAYRSIGARIEAVILDAGVDKYWNKPYESLPLDYDDGYWNRYWNAIDEIRSLARETGFSYEIVIPDYVDDYSRAWKKKHVLWIEECSDYVTNIDRTLYSIIQVVDTDPRQPWLIPAQGYEDVPESIYFSIKQLEELGLTKRYRIAIANLCTSRAANTIAETVRKAREACRDCSFHVFGPSLSGVKKLLQEKLLRYGDSWDSTAWTFPRISHGWSCKNERERILYFLMYLDHLEKSLR